MKTSILSKIAAISFVVSSSSIMAQAVSGSGTINKIPKFTAASVIGNSQITDDGTLIGIGANPISGEYVSIVKNQNATTRLHVRNVTVGTSAVTSVNALAIGSTINMAAYNQNYNPVSNGYSATGIFQPATGVINTTGFGGINLGTTTASQLSLWTNNISRLTVTDVGNIGIGKNNPAALLDVNGNAKFIGLESSVNHAGDYGYNQTLNVTRNLTKAIGVFNTTDLVNTEKFIVWGSGRTDIRATTKTDKYFIVNDLSAPASPIESFAVSGNGYTKINITNPVAMGNVFDIYDVTNSLQLFRVKADGHVFAREVEIKPTNQTFPDYVFEKNYNLLPLSEVEKYINNNKHLPGFEKGTFYEENGIKSSEMFIKQQEKIEELTLYIIELEKRLNSIEKSIKKQ